MSTVENGVKKRELMLRVQNPEGSVLTVKNLQMNVSWPAVCCAVQGPFFEVRL